MKNDNYTTESKLISLKNLKLDENSSVYRSRYLPLLLSKFDTDIMKNNNYDTEFKMKYLKILKLDENSFEYQSRCLLLQTKLDREKRSAVGK